MSVPSAGATPTSFGNEGTEAAQMDEPHGIAVEEQTGDVYIADRNNSRIDKFGPEGEFLLAWGWAVADGATTALQTCTTTCFGGENSKPLDPNQPFAGPGTGQFREAEGIAVDNDAFNESHGEVYVLDAENHRVQKFGPEGEFLLMFGGEVNATTHGDVCLAGESCQAGVAGTAPGEFEGLQGRSIAVDSEGTVYVGDENRVQLFSEDGAIEREVALPGAGAVENLAVDSAKSIYVKSSALEGVRKYEGCSITCTGKELGASRDEAGHGEALSIAIGPSDELLVNDLREGRHHILSFTAVGAETASFDLGGETQDAGGHGIAYSENTRALYVVNRGSVRVVTQPPPGPLVLEEATSEIQPSTATLEARVNPEGQMENASEESEFHFDYGETPSYGSSTPSEVTVGGNFEDRGVSAAFTELHSGTVYHFRVVVTNAEGRTTDGPDETFTTLPAVSIDNTSASQVTATSARLEVELNPHSRPSEYHFEYDTTPYGEGEAPHGTSAPIPDASAGEGAVDEARSAPIQGLSTSTTYYYRVVAHNALGVVEGPDRFFTTQGASASGAGGPPDNRAWELVSPPNKHGAPLEAITDEGGIMQAAADGGAFAYVAEAPVSSAPEGVRSPEDSQLLSTRGSSGWSTQEIATPHEAITIPSTGIPSEYRQFSQDLTAAVLEPQGVTPLSAMTTERTPYRREANGEYVPLVTAANVLPGTRFGGQETTPGSGQWGEGVSFETASPDLTHVVLGSRWLLTPGFAPGFAPGNQNLYELSSGTLRLISILPPNGNGEERPAAEAGLQAVVGHGKPDMRGAVSSDGDRVVFETTPEQHLYLRDLGLGKTLRLDERQAQAAGGAGVPFFKGASSDAHMVFFTDESRLTADATARPQRPDLYMCEVAVTAGHLSCMLSDLSVAPNRLEAADVQQVASSDASGTHVYFAANGVLTATPNARGEHAVAGDCASEHEACDLYMYDTGLRHLSLVAVLSGADAPDWSTQLGELTVRASPNGRYLAFMSQRSLTGYDNEDVTSKAHGERLDEEVFIFDSATGALHCVSCNPTGARPHGILATGAPGLLVDRPGSWAGKWLAASIPGWTRDTLTQALYQSRYVTDGGRVFFNSADALVAQDTNGVEDVYEYEPPAGTEGAPSSDNCTSASPTYSSDSGGCVSLISSGTSKEESAFLDASETGDDVFLLSAARLSTADVDSAFDVYDAHVCSSSSPCPRAPLPPPACEGDACQSAVAPPNDPTPASLTFGGSGNAAPPTGLVKPPKTAAQIRAQELAKALRACRKKKSRSRRATCERHAKKRYGPWKVKRAISKHRARS